MMNRHDRRAVNMIELVIVLVVAGIISTMGIGSYRNFTENSRGRNAVTNLSVIYNAEKRYKLSNTEYFACGGCAVSDLNKELGIFIDDPYFTYEITADADGFTATATRNANGNGPCTGKTVTITNESSIPQEDCIAWGWRKNYDK